MLKLNTGIDLAHIPYKGTADAMRDLLGGQVQLMFDGMATATVNSRAGPSRWRSPIAGAMPPCPTCRPLPSRVSTAST